MFKKRFLKIKSASNPRRTQCLFRKQKGQSALEFLLVLPIFVVAFLLVVDLGMLMYQFVSISNAVREGARYGAINCGDGSCTDNEVKSRVIARSGGVLVESPEHQQQIKVDWLDKNDPPNFSAYDRGDSVVVSVNHPYEFMFFPGSIAVVSCADMSLEQSDQGNGSSSVTTTSC